MLTKDTKVSDIVYQYPGLIEELKKFGIYRFS